MRKFCFIIILFLLTVSAYSRDKQSVLFLVSYDSSFPTFQKQYNGLLNSFKKNQKDVDLHIEFLDSKRFSYEKVKAGIYESLKFKVENSEPFDYIISADDNALKFILEYEDMLFPETPVVFFGVNNTELAYSQNNKFITGFIEEISYKETLDAVKKVLPAAEDLYILYDATSSGSSDYERIKTINDSGAALDITLFSLSEMSFDELYSKIAGFNINQPILLLSAFVDKNNKILSFSQSVKKIGRKKRFSCFSSVGTWYRTGISRGKSC